MTLEDFGNIGERVGAIATVATLAYLAVQIRHNTRVTRTSSLQSMLDGGRDRTIMRIASNAEVADIFARGLTALELLDATEKVRFTWMLVEQLFDEHAHRDWKGIRPGPASERLARRVT